MRHMESGFLSPGSTVNLAGKAVSAQLKRNVMFLVQELKDLKTLGVWLNAHDISFDSVWDVLPVSSSTERPVYYSYI